LDSVFYIGIYQFSIGVLNFFINDFTISSGIEYIGFYYDIPEVVDVLYYLILLTINLVASLGTIMLPVIKYSVYSIYFGLGSHGEDLEIYFDITKSCIAALSFVYTLFFTIGNI